MVEIACTCDDLPAHDHFMGWADQDYHGVKAWGPVYDSEDIGRIWVPWKDVARALITDTPRGEVGLP
jgi:hypothetical protein